MTAPAETKNELTNVPALVTLNPAQYTAEVYKPFKDRLSAAIESVRTIDYDITTVKGLEVVTKARRLMMDIRIEAEKERKARKDPIIQIGKMLEYSYKAVEENVLPLETFFDGEIKAEEQRKEAEKQAKLAAERLRIEGIQARIKQFSDLVLQSAGKSAAAIEGLIEQLQEIAITDVDFEEFIPQATEAKETSLSALEVAYEAAAAAEQAIEAARIKREEEDRQRAAEAAKLEEQRAEQAKIAAAQAAESKRLADIASAQAAELARAQKEADDKIKAQVAAENARIQAEADARAAEHAKAMAELNRQRAEFEAQQAAKAAEDQAKADRARADVDHEEALLMNAEHDQRQRDLAAAVNAPAVADAIIEKSRCELELIASAVADCDITETPTDEEILTVCQEAFGLSRDDMIERLATFSLRVFVNA
jgi:chemotaxis protein histidine kinase CheA